MALTDCQSAALGRLAAHVASDAVAFSLQGGAGVGKTFLTGRFVADLLRDGHRVVVAAPTHKACRVLRMKLSAAGVRWCFKPRGEVPPGHACVDTTAALLGVRPVIEEDQTEDEVAFKPSALGGSLGKLLLGNDFGGAPVLVVDEASMVGRDDLLNLIEQLRGAGAKLVCVGDEGQLPPVKKQAIDFRNDFDGGSFTLDQVVRQAAESDIVRLAWALRSGEQPAEELIETAGLIGDEVRRCASGGELVGEYLAQIERPVDDEGRRSVFIAFRNVVVDEVQEKACRKLYGHGRGSFEPGELVLAASACHAEVSGTYIGKDGVVRPSKFKKQEQVCAVADQMRVLEFDAEAAHPILGVPVRLERVDVPQDSPDRTFASHYLAGHQLADEQHPFNAMKRELARLARGLQDRLKELRERRAEPGQIALVDQQRRQAWQAFFAHQNKVVSFAHPFAITAHKSQGSTYREVFVAAQDLLRHDPRALYVAVTRPSERLWL